MNDLLLFALNGGGWALKPILEKISVDKIGHYYFSFFRYFISGIIAIPFLIQHYYFNGFPKIYKNNSKLFVKDVVIWGTIVSIVAIAAIMANYYLLEKYDSSFVTPIAEATLLIFNAIFSAYFKIFVPVDDLIAFNFGNLIFICQNFEFSLL